MQMTRELKKRFGAVEERIGKLEKRKPVQRTNGEDLDTGSPSELESRVETIEGVLQIPGEDAGATQIVSDWREFIENKLQIIETVLVMPGEEGFLSGFADKVDKAITGVKERLLKLEQTPDPTVDVSDVRKQVQVLQKAVEEIQLTPDPSKTILEFDDRLQKLEEIPDPSSEESPTVRQLESVKSRLRGSEAQRHTVVYLENTSKDHQDRLIKLEKIIRSDFPIRVFGEPFTDWIKNTGDRIEELERKPVAGSLSNTLQDMNLEIEGNTREIKALRSRVRRVTWLSLLLFAMILLSLAMTRSSFLP